MPTRISHMTDSELQREWISGWIEWRFEDRSPWSRRLDKVGAEIRRRAKAPGTRRWCPGCGQELE